MRTLNAVFQIDGDGLSFWDLNEPDSEFIKPLLADLEALGVVVEGLAPKAGRMLYVSESLPEGYVPCG